MVISGNEKLVSASLLKPNFIPFGHMVSDDFENLLVIFMTYIYIIHQILLLEFKISYKQVCLIKWNIHAALAVLLLI